MMDRTTEFRVQRNQPLSGYSVWIISRCADGSLLRVAEPIVMGTVEEGNAAEPSMSLTDNEVQVMIDELWAAGVRPSNGEGHVGQIGATEKHLGDMRSLVEHYTGKELK